MTDREQNKFDEHLVEMKMIRHNTESAGKFFSWYQSWVFNMSKIHPSLIETVTGLGGECGEVLEVIKKIERDGEVTPKRFDDLHSELGDLMHYIARVMNHYHIELDDVLLHNIDKLEERHKKDEG